MGSNLLYIMYNGVNLQLPCAFPPNHYHRSKLFPTHIVNECTSIWCLLLFRIEWSKHIRPYVGNHNVGSTSDIIEGFLRHASKIWTWGHNKPGARETSVVAGLVRLYICDCSKLHLFFSLSSSSPSNTLIQHSPAGSSLGFFSVLELSTWDRILAIVT